VNIRRMARWLAYFEPEFFRVNTGLGNFVLMNEKPTEGKMAFLHQIVQMTEDLDIHFVDQDRLFGTCARAAIARGWYPAIKYAADEQWAAEITADGSGDVLAQVETVAINEFGLAMAQALIETRETNWQSRDPEAVQP
jgi:hypothetical protein